jgi:hypothetical protein
LFFNFDRLLLKITQIYRIFDAYNMFRKNSTIQKYKFCSHLCTHLEHRNYLLLTKLSSRLNTKKDLLNMVVSSDPYTNSIRNLPEKDIETLTDTVRSFLVLHGSSKNYNLNQSFSDIELNDLEVIN